MNGRLLAASVGALVFLLSIVAAPLAFMKINFLSAEDIEKMSYLGQAYGGIGAVVSALSLLGISYGLIVQQAQLQQSRLQLLREQHNQLLGQALTDATLAPAWGNFGSNQSDEEWRAETYANLIVSYWQMIYELGSMSDTELRLNAGRFFEGKIGRAYWARAGDLRKNLARGTREKAFCSIMEGMFDAHKISSRDED